MKRKFQLLIIIFINIIVSVAATLTVLYLWKRTHPYPNVSSFGVSTNESKLSNNQIIDVEYEAIIEAELPNLNEDIDIQIRTIVGAGDLNVEYVEIANMGQNPANLTDWRLIDEHGHEFIFPALILHGGGAIKILSKAGTDTIIELFWKAERSVWQSGETARLVNPDGETMASYLIP